MAEQLDKLIIRDLSIRAIVGIRQHEREKKQDLLINIVMYADVRTACKSDDISDSVDYSILKKQIVEDVEASDYFLIERLAQHIADLCLADHRVRRVEVSVDKPTALRYARSVAVSITREQTADAG